MEIKRLSWFGILLLFVMMVCDTYAQNIQPLYSKSIQYTIINGRPKFTDEKQAALVKASLINIRYALNHYLGKEIWKNEIQVKQCNIRFYIQKTDTLLTTVYSIGFSKPIEERALNVYKEISFPPSIIPENDYVLWRNPGSLIIVSVFFNMAASGNGEDYNRKQQNLKLIQNWLKERYKGK